MILERISAETGVSVEQLDKIVRTANHRYRSYTIAKRTVGRRQIDHPAPELKFLQRWMNRNLFYSLPVHQAARAYSKGSSVAENARLHLRQNYLLKIDFENFFPSLTAEDVRSLLNENLRVFDPMLPADEIDIVIRTVCKDGALTIGAPSSPMLSNAIMYNFDCFVHNLCENHQAIYSRYADDIFISTNLPNRLSELLDVIREHIRDRRSPTLQINNRKTVFTSRKRKRVITGIVLSSNHELSVGRKKKRQIRTLVHLYRGNELPIKDVSYLRGYIAYVNSVEPEFVVRLRRKFGDDVINRLIQEELVSRKPR